MSARNSDPGTHSRGSAVCESGHALGRLSMTLDPFRLWRRHRRREREALEEVQHLRRRHGAEALKVAEEKLLRPDLTSWSRIVL